MLKPEATILIAEDDDDDFNELSLVVTTLLPFSTCIHQPDGSAAIKYLKTSPSPDLVFLDLNLPLRNGKVVLLDIERHDWLPAGVPIIIS